MKYKENYLSDKTPVIFEISRSYVSGLEIVFYFN